MGLPKQRTNTMTKKLPAKALNKNVATKWNMLSQLMQKIVSPLTNIILAHILAPEIFGIVASITLVTSFLDIFTEAGFQKYLVYCDAKDDQEFKQTVSVAFWTNFALSMFLFIGLIVLQNPVADLVGVSGKGIAVAVAGVMLPLTSFSSIQAALFQRELQYKKLFGIRFVAAMIPMVITLPLALLGLGYWALLIGKIAGKVFNAIAMTAASRWRPKRYFSFRLFKKMFAFCSWSLGESVTTWLASNLDVLIVGSILSSYYLGLYKTSISMVNDLLRIVSSSILPVTYAVIARLKNDRPKFDREVYKSQQTLASVVLPMGAGVFLFRELATMIALGSQWGEAATLLGYWSLASCSNISFVYICDDVFRAVGRPKYSFYTHLASIALLVPAVLISANFGYGVLIVVRPLLAIFNLVTREIALRKCSDLTILKFFKNSWCPIVATAGMALVGILLKSMSSAMLWQFATIGICVIAYFGILCALPGGKAIIASLLDIILPGRKHKKSGIAAQGSGDIDS